MYVFLALAQQLELDACLIGPPNAGEVEGVNPIGANRQFLVGGPTRPFWGVGVRLGSEIAVYDPWRGEAFPANLRTLQANPDAHKNWFENAANLSGVKADDVKAALVYLAVPVNSLSVRMAMLHDKLKEPLGVRLALNPSALRSAFPDPKPAFWNPVRDRFAYGRASRTFLPRELGGADGSAPPRLFEKYKREQLPLAFNIILPDLGEKDRELVGERLQLALLTTYAPAFVDPPNPRERIQRGQFQDALRDLIAKQDTFGRDLERLHNAPNVDEQIREWLLQIKELYARLDSAVTMEARQEARAKVDAHWSNPDSPVRLMVNRIAAPICQAETVFLLALCKHEHAERAQIRADYAGEDAPALREQARQAWNEARAQWQTYDGFSDTQRGIPGRLEQARLFKERAEKYAAGGSK